VAPEPYPVLVPYKELVRHFDGYSHVGVDVNACPPLFIPEGFFSGAMNIDYGGDRRRRGAVLVNPCKSTHSTVDPEGADLKATLDDLPLFWRSRIGSIDTAASLDDRQLRRARNEAVVIAATECAAMPASKLRVALRFGEGEDVERELASLDERARQWRLARHYTMMNQLRTAAGVSRTQALWRALQDVDARD
jgi:hypothetical protein